MNTSMSSQQTIPFDERGSIVSSAPQEGDSGDNIPDETKTSDRTIATTTTTLNNNVLQSNAGIDEGTESRKGNSRNNGSAASIQQQQQPPPPPPPLRVSQMSSATSIPNTQQTNILHQPHGAPATGPSSHSTNVSYNQQHMHQQQQQQQQQYYSHHQAMGYMNQQASSSNAGAGGIPFVTSDHTTTASPLPPMVLRSLGDRSNEKRKNAALEIEALIKLLTESSNFGTINAIITVLSKDFCTSMNSNYRKGGLVGLAATAIGLHSATNNFLHVLLPPVLHCFDDPESRVRYYACESIYNMAKVTRQGILLHFNPIFDGLTKLFADVDVDVKNGANLLDRLIKDIVTEADSDTFQVDQFLPIMQTYIRRTNPFIRQLIVGWIILLDSLPDLSLLDYLPDFLDGLLNMLSDSNREIRQAADSALSDFLREITGSEVLEFGPIISILVSQCQSTERLIRLTSITWLAELSHHPLSGGDAMLPFLPDILSAILHCICDQEKEIRLVAERTNDDLLRLVRETSGAFELRPLLETLTNELLEKEDVPTKMASLRWINMLKEKRMQDMHAYTVNLLPVLLRTLSDPSDAVVLLDLQILSRISLAVSSDASTSASTISTLVDESNPPIIDKEEKNSDSPTATPSLPEPQEAQFKLVLNAILNLFAHDRQLLETRGSLIIRKLCVLLNAKAVYIRMAETLSSYETTNSIEHPETAVETIQFISTMVQTLNLILLTASELHDLRHTLANSFVHDQTFVPMSLSLSTSVSLNDKLENTNDNLKVFTTIFNCWCHNPIATFSLCLLAKAYDISFQLVQRFSEMRDVTVGFLMQIDKLVYLLESPIFIHLRLQFLNVESPDHEQLLKSLYGILMCLPQGEAFRILNERLTTVCNLRESLGYSTIPSYVNDAEDHVDDDTNVRNPDQTVTAKLLERYDSVVERHHQVKALVEQKATAIPGTSEIGTMVSNVDGTAGINSLSSPITASSQNKSSTLAASFATDQTLTSNVPKNHYPFNEFGTNAALNNQAVQLSHSFNGEQVR
jgi:vacuole morphology and inheritance protein 14